MTSWNLTTLRSVARNLEDQARNARERGNFPRADKLKHGADFIYAECDVKERAMKLPVYPLGINGKNAS